MPDSSTVKGLRYAGFPAHLPNGYAMLTSPNRGETAVHSYHYRGDMVVRMRKVLAIPLTAELVRVLQCLIYRIPVFISGTWILDSNLLWDPGFLELFSGLQSPGFRIP